MSKWKCDSQHCKKTCYSEPPEHCCPTVCLLNRNNIPNWRKETESTTNGSQLPKLTVEVFDRPDCPKWAQYAAINSDGWLLFFEYRPILKEWFSDRCWTTGGKGDMMSTRDRCDASDWANSLIERPEKKETLPDWCTVDAMCWHKRCGYFKVTYIDSVSSRVDIQQVDDKSKGYLSFHTVCNETCQAHLRPYNEKEMQGLVGKVVGNKHGNMFLVTAFVVDDGGEVCVDGVVYNADDLLECYTIDGEPCGKFEHLENGKWVE